MAGWYDRYQRGFHQEVYDELFALQGRIYDPEIYEEALPVVRAMMRRVRSNIELLLPRLQQLGFLFGKGGFWEDPFSEEQVLLEPAEPIFQAPTSETWEHVAALEQLVGSLPLSLKCWFEEVGMVNLIGLFPSHSKGDGPVLLIAA